jgi:hypothetical protein
MPLLEVVEFLGEHLSPKDAGRLSCVSKDVRDAVASVEEEIFGRNDYVQLLKKAVWDKEGKVLCTHVSASAERCVSRIPMRHGKSSRGQLRSILWYIAFWNSHPISIQVHLSEKFHIKLKGMGDDDITITEDCLYTTATYSKEMRKVVNCLVLFSATEKI